MNLGTSDELTVSQNKQNRKGEARQKRRGRRWRWRWRCVEERHVDVVAHQLVPVVRQLLDGVGARHQLVPHQPLHLVEAARRVAGHEPRAQPRVGARRRLHHHQRRQLASHLQQHGGLLRRVALVVLLLTRLLQYRQTGFLRYGKFRRRFRGGVARSWRSRHGGEGSARRPQLRQRVGGGGGARRRRRRRRAVRHRPRWTHTTRALHIHFQQSPSLLSTLDRLLCTSKV